MLCHNSKIDAILFILFYFFIYLFFGSLNKMKYVLGIPKNRLPNVLWRNKWTALFYLESVSKYQKNLRCQYVRSSLGDRVNKHSLSAYRNAK